MPTGHPADSGRSTSSRPMSRAPNSGCSGGPRRSSGVLGPRRWCWNSRRSASARSEAAAPSWPRSCSSMDTTSGRSARRWSATARETTTRTPTTSSPSIRHDEKRSSESSLAPRGASRPIRAVDHPPRRDACRRSILHFVSMLGSSLALVLSASARPALASNYTTAVATAAVFGVHEIALVGSVTPANPFDVAVKVRFTPASGEKHAVTVDAFYDGGTTWRARLYVSEPGSWRWTSPLAVRPVLYGQTGTFAAQRADLRGILRRHPRQSPTMDHRGWSLVSPHQRYGVSAVSSGRRERLAAVRA